MEDARFSWRHQTTELPFVSPQVHSLVLCKMQKSPCLQIQGCQGSEAVAGVILYSSNGLEQLLCPSRGMEWDPSCPPCCLELGEQCPGKRKEPGLKRAQRCEGRRVESYLPINQDINLNYEHLKKTEVHAKEYSVRQGSLWCHLFSWQAAEIAAIEEVPSS